MEEAPKRSEEIRQFILEGLEEDPLPITRFVTEKFKISRQAVNRYLQKLEAEGLIASTGKTFGTQYFLRSFVSETFRFSVTPDLSEDKVWREKMSPFFEKAKPNIVAICQHGFTEMLNNVVDHSEAKNCTVNLEMNWKKIKMAILDNGIGIFEKIMRQCHLEDHRHAILELAKGKLTTDPENHSGEGIFFTSRMFDKFSILSKELYFSCQDDEDWLIEDAKQSKEGTSVFLTLNQKSERTVREIFSRFASEADDYGFTRTHVPVNLARYGNENLVSRSQAKRLLLRFERFKEVFLDFGGVEMIGQAFADEIFRVFRNANPNTMIIWINANKSVEAMIRSIESKQERK